MASAPSPFVAHVLDLLGPLGDVRARRMFGGHGIYRDDLMFGLVADDVLYLKVDDENRGDFEARGLGPFEYAKQGRTQHIAYHQAPEDALEDAEMLIAWSRRAWEAAVRAAAKKSARRRAENER